ncbi:unnamed protein product [Effrenium voratum]|uniref:Uncharacterized protein n=1 Tax=Effrenium voratum TaxID=2562239 RepID=A0AA36JNW1_9DINO|nr:unnamed protein product [Effrenium voratum]
MFDVAILVKAQLAGLTTVHAMMQPMEFPSTRPSLCLRAASVAPSASVAPAGARGIGVDGLLKVAPAAAAMALAARAKRVKVKMQKGKSGSEPRKMAAWEKDFRKKFGDESIVDLKKAKMEVPTFSTGALTLDMALGGGLPYGRMVEVYGPEQSGKTTLATTCCISAQQTGRRKKCAYIDVEQAFDLNYAKAMGLNIDEDVFVFCSPTSAEKALEMAIDLTKSNNFDLVVIDSAAALCPDEEDQKDMADHSMALRARLLSKFCRKVTGPAADSGTTIFIINQMRANIGGYGLAEDTVGGKAIKYHASVRMEVRSPKSGMIGTAEQPTGIRCRVKIVKNKLAAPHRVAEYDIIFGKGISWESCLLEAGIEKNLVEKKGAWRGASAFGLGF